LAEVRGVEKLDEALPDWAKDVFDAEKTPTKKKASAKAQDKDDIDVSAFNPKTDGKYKIQKFAKGRVNRGNYGNKVNAAEVDTPDAHDEDKAIDHNSGIKAGVDHPWIPKPKTPVTKAAKTVSQGVTGKQKQQDQAKLAQHHQALLDRINRTPKKGRAALMGRLPKEYHHMVEAFGERDAHRELSIGADMPSGGGAPIKNKGITTTNHAGATASHGSLGEANRHIMSSIKPGESHTLHDNGVKVATMTHRAGQIHTEFH